MNRWMDMVDRKMNGYMDERMDEYLNRWMVMVHRADTQQQR